MGCSLAASLVDLKKQLKRNFDPDLLFIEPSEMVVTQELRNVAAMGLRDIHYDTGPFITLIDGERFEFLWSERQPLLLGHVKDADVVAISRADLMGKDTIKGIEEVMSDYCHPLILSMKETAALKKLINLIGSEQREDISRSG